MAFGVRMGELSNSDAAEGGSVIFSSGLRETGADTVDLLKGGPFVDTGDVFVENSMFADGTTSLGLVSFFWANNDDADGGSDERVVVVVVVVVVGGGPVVVGDVVGNVPGTNGPLFRVDVVVVSAAAAERLRGENSVAAESASCVGGVLGTTSLVGRSHVVVFVTRLK